MEEKLKELLNRIKKGRHSKEDLVLASEIARETLKYLVNKSIPVIPENYQLWFYTFGTLISKGIEDPTENEIEKTYKEISRELGVEIPPNILAKIQKRTRDILNSSIDILHKSTLNLEEFDNKLDLSSTRLQEAKPNMAELINTLAEEIQSLRKENQTLTKELRLASKQLIQLNEKIAYHIEQASVDFLTQVLTRRAFERLLELKLDNLKKTGIPFCLIMLDPDNFKEINDTFGHVAGDQVLRTLAFTIKLALREDDIIARYGGDEFAIVISSELDETIKVAKRLKREIERMRIIWNNSEIKITASFGIAQATPEDSITSLVHRADMALYLAKRSGKNMIKTERDLEEKCR